MQMYVRNSLQKLQHKLPKRVQYARHRHKKPAYGHKVQYSKNQNKTDIVYLPESTKKITQQIIGIFLYYGLAPDQTMFLALGTLEFQKY